MIDDEVRDLSARQRSAQRLGRHLKSASATFRFLRGAERTLRTLGRLFGLRRRRLRRFGLVFQLDRLFLQTLVGRS